MRVFVVITICLLGIATTLHADELTDAIRACGKPTQISKDQQKGNRIWRSITFLPASGHEITARFFASVLNGPWYYEGDDTEEFFSECKKYKALPAQSRFKGIPGQPYQDSEGTWHRVVAFDCPTVIKNLNQIAAAKDGPWTWATPGPNGDTFECPGPSEEEKRAKECPSGIIRTGMTRQQVYACLGTPDHINSDFSTDQLVFGNGTFVYINRSTGRVENMQWTH